MSKIKEIEISHTTNEDAMYGSDGPGEDVDTDASAIRFEEMVEAEILKQYPGSVVSFTEGNGMSTKAIIDGDYDHEDADHILWGIYHEVWETWYWVIRK